MQTIADISLLSEIVSFTTSGNYDRVSGNIGNIGLLHFLDKNYIYPKVGFRKKEEEETSKPQESKRLNFFKPQQTTNKYFRKR